MAHLFLFLMGMAPPDVLEGYLLISQVHSSKKSSVFAVSNLKSVAFYINILNSAILHLLLLLAEWKPDSLKEGRSW